MTDLQGFCFWVLCPALMVFTIWCAWKEKTTERTNGHPDIRASAISDTLPEYECEHHGVDGGGTDYYGTSKGEA